MNENILRIEEKEQTVSIKTTKYYISEKFFDKVLRDNDIHITANWKEGYDFKFSHSAPIIGKDYEGYNIWGTAKEVSRYMVEKLVGDAIGHHGNLIINVTIDRDDDDCSSKRITKYCRKAPFFRYGDIRQSFL